MSAAAASPTAAEAAPKKARGKGKLLIIVGLVLAVVLAAAGGAVFFMSQQAAQAEGGEDAADDRPRPRREARATPPVFVPLEVFTVNLADRGGDRFAQIGVTLEVADTSVEPRLKAVMPVIRSRILLALARKTSDELLQHEGRLRLAAEIRVETLRPLGHEVTLDDILPAADGAADDSPQRRHTRRALHELPVQQVHFSNFIIQ